MRLALKHQIILAPAVVLCLMTLLLCFLQFTYWDLSVDRQKAKDLKTAFIAMAEADLAAQRMQATVHFLAKTQAPDPAALEQMTMLYTHLATAIEKLEVASHLGAASLSLLRQGVADLDPEKGMVLEQFEAALSVLRPQLTQQLKELNLQREKLGNLHREDMEALVAETTFVTIIVLGIAILVGILLSLFFARHILRRIQVLSDSAARITRGEFLPPPAPEVVSDELDELAVSINQMTEQLIRVVAAEKLLEGAEEERRRIAMDIHDQTLADLSAVRRGLENLQGSTSCSAEVVTIETDLLRAIANLRVVMDNLHPQTLDILGLPAAVESLLEKLHLTPGSPEYHFLCGDEVADLNLSRLVQVTLYRVVGEAVTNVLRHARASVFEVSLMLRGENLVIAVEDNGCGFGPVRKAPAEGGGRGVLNISERARAIGATVEWRRSRFSSGTRFELLLPRSTA